MGFDARWRFGHSFLGLDCTVDPGQLDPRVTVVTRVSFPHRQQRLSHSLTFRLSGALTAIMRGSIWQRVHAPSQFFETFLFGHLRVGPCHLAVIGLPLDELGVITGVPGLSEETEDRLVGQRLRERFVIGVYWHGTSHLN